MARETELARLVEVRRLTESGEARRRRMAAGLSLSEVAEPSDVDTSTIWRWEMRKRRPRGQAALRYLSVLALLPPAPEERSDATA